MATRNILNPQGEVIGELTLPDETSEERWAIALGTYANTPPPPTIKEIVKKKRKEAKDFCNELMDAAIEENILMGITPAGKTKLVSDYLVRLARYLREGSPYAARDQLDELIAAAPIDPELAPFITVERLQVYRNKIQLWIDTPW